MLKDRYDNLLTTSSATARDNYVAALDLMLEGQAGVLAGFERVTEEAPEFALGWAGLARARQYAGDMAGAASAIAHAKTMTSAITAREASQIHVFDLMLSGKAEAYSAIRAHVALYPRDAIVVQTCSSVFGLIGFSGKPGREAELLAFNAGLLPHYGDDWWMMSQYAFALCETGNLDDADRHIDIAMAKNPANAHGAHVRSHVSYEMGAAEAGSSYLNSWLEGYDPEGVMFTHLNWHAALWTLEQGDIDLMWQKVDAAVAPEAATGSPAINVLTDTASILQRATLAGVPVSPVRWQSVSAYAKRAFPNTGNAFIDVHAALAHAMAGDVEALATIIDAPSGPAADLVPALASGFRAMAAGDWPLVAQHMMDGMSDLARIGGSRAQRDMIEQTLLTALSKQGKGEAARGIAALRRPVLSTTLA